MHQAPKPLEHPPHPDPRLAGAACSNGTVLNLHFSHACWGTGFSSWSKVSVRPSAGLTLTLLLESRHVARQRQQGYDFLVAEHLAAQPSPFALSLQIIRFCPASIPMMSCTGLVFAHSPASPPDSHLASALCSDAYRQSASPRFHRTDVKIARHQPIFRQNVLRKESATELGIANHLELLHNMCADDRAPLQLPRIASFLGQPEALGPDVAPGP